MSDASINRILDAIDGLRVEVAGLKVTVTDLKSDVAKYNGVKDRVFQLETDKKACEVKLYEIKANCAAVQAKKQKRVQPWLALIFTFLGAIIIGLVGWIFELLKQIGK